MASRTIFHIDMDAFFASVEQLDNPALKGRCVVVGGASNRGVVAAASYEARRFGIRSAMPIFQAKQRCRDLIIVPPRRKRYSELSQRVMDTLGNYSPLLEQVSIDEAYLDVTGCLRLHGTPRRMADAIKTDIFRRVRLTCSVGVAPNKFLAKIASDMHKPNGLTLIEPAAVPAFIDTLDIGKVPGVGGKARAILATLGIKTLGRVNALPPDLLTRKLGKFGHRLAQLAKGQDETPVAQNSPAKSMSSETTLDENTLDRRVLEKHLLAQSQSVARQLRKHRAYARTITLKLRTADFKRHTRSHTVDRPIQSSEAIFRQARALLAAFAIKQPIRLVGVGAGGLQPPGVPVQACLFPDDHDEGEKNTAKWQQVDKALDAISDRFGGRAIVRASLSDPDRNEKDKDT